MTRSILKLSVLLTVNIIGLLINSMYLMLLLKVDLFASFSFSVVLLVLNYILTKYKLFTSDMYYNRSGRNEYEVALAFTIYNILNYLLYPYYYLIILYDILFKIIDKKK